MLCSTELSGLLWVLVNILLMTCVKQWSCVFRHWARCNVMSTDRVNYKVYRWVFWDRPFNLHRGVMVFCFVQNFFRTTEYLFFLSREFFFQNSTLGYMTKTLNQIIFFSSNKIRIFFSATLGIRIFFRKKT